MIFDISAQLRRGDRDLGATILSNDGILCLFGPSGAGKTTMLNMIAGLLTPDAGHIRVAGRTLFDAADGVDIPPARRRCGYVFQQPRLFPHMRVRANLNYGRPRSQGDDDATRLSRDTLIALLGIGDLLNRWPDSLSGGEAQRVAIGRALLSNPQFLLMDEPLSSLDHQRRGEILDMIDRMHAMTGIPIVYVSHDREEVDRLGGTVIRIG